MLFYCMKFFEKFTIVLLYHHMAILVVQVTSTEQLADIYEQINHHHLTMYYSKKLKICHSMGNLPLGGNH